MIFNFYTTDRLGSRTIAQTLNGRGYRTTTGGPWSGHQVLRALTNRVYLGELTFRDTTITDTHEPIINTDTWAHAQTILDARGESHAHRAASGSDYMLTGLLRCPQCGKAMIGTRATGRNRTYRYYTCFTLARYDAANAASPASTPTPSTPPSSIALASFYRTQHKLIADAITTAQAQHRAAHTDRHGELAAVEADLTKTEQAIGRYLAAFERGTMDEDLVAERLIQLRTKTTQLRARRDELTLTVDDEPTTPEPATLTEIANHITEIITSGTHNQTKALVEALVAKVTITAPDRLIPVFRIPQPDHHNEPAITDPQGKTTPTAAVRTMTKLVGRVGLEPTT